MTSRSSSRRILLQAHWIVGITAGVILGIIGVTGGLLAFQQQLLDALNSDARTVVPRGKRLSPPELLQRIEEKGLAGRIARLAMPADPRGAVRVSIVDATEQSESRYIDPYTGEWQTGTGTRGEAFFGALRGLHQRLVVAGIGNEAVGRQIVGACTVLMVGLALSGLYMRWPGRVSDWRAWLLINPRLRGRNFLWSLHAVVGTYMLIPYLFLALTGLYWPYDWYRSLLYDIAGVERRSAEFMEAHAAPRRADVFALAWARFELVTRRTGFRTVTIGIPAEAGRPIQFRYLDPQPAHEDAFNVLAVSATTGEVVHHERFADKSPGGKFMSSFYALHTGLYFGALGTTFLMLAALMMPLFGITGWMMYLHRRRTKRRVPAGAVERRLP